MPTPDALKYAATLTEQMAQLLGIDLQEEVLFGQVDIGELANAVLACAECDVVAECAKLGAKHRNKEPVPPPQCQNTKLFMRLMA